MIVMIAIIAAIDNESSGLSKSGPALWRQRDDLSHRLQHFVGHPAGQNEKKNGEYPFDYLIG